MEEVAVLGRCGWRWASQWGAVTGDMGLWLPLGMALGLLLGAGQKKKRAPGMGARSEKE